MKKNTLCAVLAALSAFTNAFSAGEQILDFNTLPVKGVKVLKDYSGTPTGTDGILVTYEAALPPFEAGCYFSADGQHWPADANRELPWVIKDNFKDLYRDGYIQNTTVKKPNREGLFTLLHLKSGEYLALVPLAGPETVAWLRVNEDGRLLLNLGTLGTEPVSGDLPLLAWCRSPDVYTACREAWALAVKTNPVKGRTALRMKKEYPEVFEYLGWCSWEQYKKDISSQLLCGAVDSIEASGLPIRWVLVDDGHQTSTDKLKKLVGLEPDATKFPNGWKPLLDKRDPDKVKWIGLWHCFQGLWQGIALDNELGALNEHLMTIGKAKFPKDDPESASAFYDALIGSVKTYGFDFVKIDVQASNLDIYRGTANAARTAAMNAQALETATRRDVHGLINCMAHNSTCVVNTRNSAITRCSIDYKVGSADKGKSHLQQSYNNTLWLGQTLWPDHDMFHTSDPYCGRMMAVSKALSGGPIYLSDAPEDMVAEYIKPLCFEDGKLLRPLAPAVPLPDSIFLDVMNKPVAYRVIAPLPNGCAAVAVYSLMEPSPKKPVSATVTPADYLHAGGMIQPFSKPWKLPQEGLIVFDWYRQTGKKLDSYTVTLEGFSDSFALLCPVENDWAVVGRTDKYLSPCAVEKISAGKNKLKLKLVESGPVVIWSGKGAPQMNGEKLTALGNGFWKADLTVKPGTCSVTITR